MALKIEENLAQALENAINWMEQVTGEKATQDELASALKRYFVLNEIKDHIVMERRGEAGE